MIVFHLFITGKMDVVITYLSIIMTALHVVGSQPMQPVELNCFSGHRRTVNGSVVVDSFYSILCLDACRLRIGYIINGGPGSDFVEFSDCGGFGTSCPPPLHNQQEAFKNCSEIRCTRNGCNYSAITTKATPTATVRDPRQLSTTTSSGTRTYSQNWLMGPMINLTYAAFLYFFVT